MTRSAAQASHASAPRSIVEQRQAIAEMLRGEATVLSVDGDCMSPVLEDRWQIEISPRRARAGDVVAVGGRDGQLVVHRYLGQRPWRDRSRGRWVRLAVTRPDAGHGFDPEVPCGDVLGVVTGKRCVATDEFTPFHVPFNARVRASLWFGRYLLRRLVRGPLRATGKAVAGSRRSGS